MSQNSATSHRAPTSALDLDFRPRGPVMPSPADWRDVVVYQVMIDRFDDGGDHPPYVAGRTKTGRDPQQGYQWQGGNLKGLMRRLDYIQDLGAGAVWVSSPLRQRLDSHTYHGYAPQNFLDVDPRYGDTDDFAAFVRAAHDRGMRVIMDIVIEHTGDLWHYAPGQGTEGRDHPVWAHGHRFEFGAWNRGDPQKGFGPDDAVWPVELQDPDAFRSAGDMADIGTAGGAEAVEGDFMGLKHLDLLNPRVMTVIINCYKYWIAVADVDGFRIDALKHAPRAAASDFIHAIREYALSIGKTNFLQVGEVIGSDEEMRLYIGNNIELRESGASVRVAPGTTADYPHLDAVLDHTLQTRLVPVVRGEAPPKMLDDLVVERARVYRDQAAAGKYYVAYLENHDLGARDHHRLLHATFHQEPKGYDRPGGDPRLAIMAYTVLLCGMGIPCLYYGTEQGFDGGGEEDYNVREAMFGGQWGPFDTVGAGFFDPTHPIYQATARLCAIRAREPALRYGRQYLRPISGDGVHFGPPEHPGAPFAFARVLDVTEIVIAANPSLEEREVCVMVDGLLNPGGATMADLMDEGVQVPVEQHGEDAPTFVRISLGPRSARVLRQAGQ